MSTIANKIVNILHYLKWNNILYKPTTKNINILDKTTINTSTKFINTIKSSQKKPEKLYLDKKYIIPYIHDLHSWKSGLIYKLSTFFSQQRTPSVINGSTEEVGVLARLSQEARHTQRVSKIYVFATLCMFVCVCASAVCTCKVHWNNAPWEHKTQMQSRICFMAGVEYSVAAVGFARKVLGLLSLSSDLFLLKNCYRDTRRLIYNEILIVFHVKILWYLVKDKNFLIPSTHM